MKRLFLLRRPEYFADFFITPPITAALLVLSLRQASWAWPLWFAGGLFAWVFYEYSVHRWVAHGFPFLRDIHGIHHARQQEYVALHPVLTVALYVGLWLAFGVSSSAGMVGFSIGYIAYSVCHTLFHYASIRPGHPLFRAKRRHAIHHSLDNVNYGVTTPLFDIIFRTYRT